VVKKNRNNKETKIEMEQAIIYIHKITKVLRSVNDYNLMSDVEKIQFTIFKNQPNEKIKL